MQGGQTEHAPASTPAQPPLPGQGWPSLTVDRKPHLLAGEAHCIGGCADIGPCVLDRWPGDDQGAVLLTLVGIPEARSPAMESQVTSAKPTSHGNLHRSSPHDHWAHSSLVTFMVTGFTYLGPGDGGGGNS